MDLAASLRKEAAQILPSVKSTMIFTISFRAADTVLNNRYNSGLYMLLTTLTCVLILLGVQAKCNNCLQTQASAWWAPVMEALTMVLDASMQIAVAFASNMLASLLSDVLLTAQTAMWAAWWAAMGLVLAGVATRFIT